MPHPELHGGKKPKNVWAQLEDGGPAFLEFVDKHSLEHEEGNLFSYLVRVMNFARKLGAGVAAVRVRGHGGARAEAARARRRAPRRRREVDDVIGVISAMPEELAAVVADDRRRARWSSSAAASFTAAPATANAVVCVVSRIGKVAAATTTAILLERFQPRALVDDRARRRVSTNSSRSATS